MVFMLDDLEQCLGSLEFEIIWPFELEVFLRDNLKHASHCLKNFLLKLEFCMFLHFSLNYLLTRLSSVAWESYT